MVSWSRPWAWNTRSASLGPAQRSTSPGEEIAPPTNSVARGGPSITDSDPSRDTWCPVRVTFPAKNVWMSPVMKVTSRMPAAATWSISSARSAV